jgi:anti-sigma factor RsiW
MNHDTELKLQAYLDAELPAEEARLMEEWLTRDAQARAVCEELRATKKLLQGNELPRTLSESREFYWSKIERAILRGEQVEQPVSPVATIRKWWFRLAAPLAGATLLGAVLFVALRSGTSSSGMAYFHEVETPVEESTGITFHSEAAHMIVVWVPSQEK